MIKADEITIIKKTDSQEIQKFDLGKELVNMNLQEFLDLYNDSWKVGYYSCDGISSAGKNMEYYTYHTGYGEENHEYEVKNALDMVDWLVDINRITKEEKEKLKPMVLSKELQQFYIAVLFIKQKQSGKNIQIFNHQKSIK